MSIDFLPVLKAEIADLEEEIRNDPRYRKLLRLREALAEYEPKPARAPVAASTRQPVAGSMPRGDDDAMTPTGDSVFRERSNVNRSELLKHLLRSPMHRERRNPEGRQTGGR
jgi:hypothetical protein